MYEIDDPALRYVFCLPKKTQTHYIRSRDDPTVDENTRLRNRIAELESLVRELRGVWDTLSASQFRITIFQENPIRDGPKPTLEMEIPMKSGIQERRNVRPSNARQMIPAAIIGPPLETQLLSALSRQNPFLNPRHPCIVSHPHLALHQILFDIINLSLQTSEQVMAVAVRHPPMMSHSLAVSMSGPPLMHILLGIMGTTVPAQLIQTVAVVPMEMDMLMVAATTTIITDRHLSKITVLVDPAQLLK